PLRLACRDSKRTSQSASKELRKSRTTVSVAPRTGATETVALHPSVIARSFDTLSDSVRSRRKPRCGGDDGGGNDAGDSSTDSSRRLAGNIRNCSKPAHNMA